MRLGILACSAAFFASFSAQAQDECREVLLHGITDASTHIASSSSAAADREFYCSATLDEARDYYDKQDKTQHDGGGGGGISYGPFSLNGGGSQSNVGSNSLTQEHLDHWQNNTCTADERDRQNHSFEYLAQQNVASKVVDDWRDCMIAREGLTCWIEPYDEITYFKMNWRKFSDSHAKVHNSFVMGGISHWSGASTDELLPTNSEIDRGTTNIPVTRKNPEQYEPISMSLNVEHDGNNFECTAYVPPKPKPEKPVVAISRVVVGIQTSCRNAKCSGLVLPQDPGPYRVELSPAISPLPGEALKANTAQRYNVLFHAEGNK